MRTFLARALLKATRRERWVHFQQQMANQWLSQDELEEQSRQRLTGLLRHAGTRVPYFQKFCHEAGFDPATITHTELASFPLLTKQDMMVDQERFIDGQAAPSDLWPNATGGSSGIWFQHFIDKKSLQIRIANDLRGRTWSGWQPGESQAILWGHAGDNKQAESLRGRFISEFVHRSHTLNVYNMDDEDIARYYRKLHAFKPQMLLGYASALAFFAEYLKKEKHEFPTPKGIISSAETLTDDYRNSIESYFDCPLLNRYGSREFATIAQQCEQVGGMHVMIDRMVVEILRPDGSTCLPGERGEIVITDLDNLVMPFIRYRTGDLAKSATEPCACGRGFPVLESVDGRTSELLVGKNGKYYSCQSPRLFGADIPGIGQMQLIQETLDEIEIKIVPDSLWNETSEEQLRSRMLDLLGNIAVKITPVDEIPPAPSGKFPFTISKVSPFHR